MKLEIMLITIYNNMKQQKNQHTKLTQKPKTADSLQMTMNP